MALQGWYWDLWHNDGFGAFKDQNEKLKTHRILSLQKYLYIGREEDRKQKKKNSNYEFINISLLLMAQMEKQGIFCLFWGFPPFFILLF